MMTDYTNLLSFFDPKKFDLEEVAKIIDLVITKAKEKGGNHQAGCAWVIIMLYKKGKCDTTKFDQLIDEFNEYLKDYDDYVNSLVMGDITEAPFTYYNGFLYKKQNEMR